MYQSPPRAEQVTPSQGQLPTQEAAAPQLDDTPWPSTDPGGYTSQPASPVQQQLVTAASSSHNLFDFPSVMPSVGNTLTVAGSYAETLPPCLQLTHTPPHSGTTTQQMPLKKISLANRSTAALGATAAPTLPASCFSRDPVQLAHDQPRTPEELCSHQPKTPEELCSHQPKTPEELNNHQPQTPEGLCSHQPRTPEELGNHQPQTPDGEPPEGGLTPQGATLHTLVPTAVDLASNPPSTPSILRWRANNASDASSSSSSQIQSTMSTASAGQSSSLQSF